MQNIDYPFYLDSDMNVHRLVPDNTTTQSMDIYRKYPLDKDKMRWREAISGRVILAKPDKAI